MRTVYKAKKTTLSPALQAYLEDKIAAPIEKLLKNDESAILEIEFAKTTSHHRKGDVWFAEANLAIGKTMLRAEETGEDPHAVIDEVGIELSQELKAFKTKNKTKQIRGARAVKRIMKKPL